MKFPMKFPMEVSQLPEATKPEVLESRQGDCRPNPEKHQAADVFQPARHLYPCAR